MKLADIQTTFEAWIFSVGCVETIFSENHKICDPKPCKFAKVYHNPLENRMIDTCRTMMTGRFQVSFFLGKDCCREGHQLALFNMADCLLCAANKDGSIFVELPHGETQPLHLYLPATRGRGAVLPRSYGMRDEASHWLVDVDIPYTTINCGCD